MRRRISMWGRVRPSVRRSVGPLVPCYFRSWKVRILGASFAVYPALFFLSSKMASRLKSVIRRIYIASKKKRKRKKERKKEQKRKKDPPPKHITRDRINSFNASYVKTENFSDQRTVVQKRKKYRKKKAIESFSVPWTKEEAKWASKWASERSRACDQNE